MVKIIKESTLKRFYEKSIESSDSSKEGLTEEIKSDFQKILKKYSEGFALDLGYGFGTYTIAMAKKGLNVIATDYINKSILQNKIKGKSYEKNIKILQTNIKYYSPKNSFDLVVAKDVLHFLPEKYLYQLLKALAKHTNPKGIHYLTMFTNINRKFENNEEIIIEDETNTTKKEFLEKINELYHGWKIDIKSENYKEENHLGLEKPFNFYANKITIIAQKD